MGIRKSEFSVLLRDLQYSNSAYNFAFIKKLRNNKKFLSSTFININGK